MQIEELLQLQCMMFILMGVGALIRKKKWLPEESKKVLTDLVIFLLLPCNIIQAFCMKMSKELLRAGIQILVISLVIQFGCSLISATCYRKVPKRQRTILQYGTICSNAGFLGNPIAEGLYGSLGLLYASIYLIPQRIVMWSAGVSYFTESPSKKEIVRKVLTHPCIIAVGIGMILLVTQIPLPKILSSSIKSLGGCTTGMTMLLIGMILADAGVKEMCNPMTLLYSLIRLILIPAAVMAFCYLAKVDPVVAGLSTVLAAMPAGSTTAILAAKYDGDEVFASQCVVLTTILSMALLPLWCLVLSRLFV